MIDLMSSSKKILGSCRCKAVRWSKQMEKFLDFPMIDQRESVTIEFPLLELCDDLIIHVLSYVSTAPFEFFQEDESLYTAFVSNELNKNRTPKAFSPFQPNSHYQAVLLQKVDVATLSQCAFGTLTHVLPLVCKKFHALCKYDLFWQEAMHRLSIANPSTWGNYHEPNPCPRKTSIHSCQTVTSKSPSQKFLQRKPIVSSNQAKLVFQRIVENEQSFTITAPIFIWHGSMPPRLGRKEILHLNKPHDRRRIIQIMSNWPIRHTTGNLIPTPRPRFLLTVSHTINVGDFVFVAEILRCRIQKTLKSLVEIMPIQQVRIESLDHACPDGMRGTVETRRGFPLDIRLPLLHLENVQICHLPLHSTVPFIVHEYIRQLIRQVFHDQQMPNMGRKLFLLSQDLIGGALVEQCPVDNRYFSVRWKGKLRNVIQRSNGSRIYDGSIDVAPLQEPVSTE